jgi:ribosomal protein S18 acetylase RimI-like enzyme
MKQLRRLDAAQASGTYQRVRQGALRHAALSEDEFRRLQRERPQLVIEDAEAVLIGQPFRRMVRLHYAFPGRDAFPRQFPGMLQRLLPAVTQDEAPLGFRFRLTDRSSRPYVEPVLTSQAFETAREWMLMMLVELPDEDPGPGDVAPGFVLRPVRSEDMEAIVRLEDLAFPTSALTVEAALEAMRTASLYRVLEETGSGAVAGSLLAEYREPATGHIATMAVHPDYQRRGLGEATMRWALACFRKEGLRRATLTVDVDNGPAIALYRKLGFVPHEFGLDYRRPIDEDEVRQVLEKHRAQHIRIRNRY